MKTLHKAAARCAVALAVVLSGLAAPAPAAQTLLVALGESTMFLAVDYQAGADLHDAALVPAPRSQAMLMHLNEEGTAVNSIVTWTPYVSECWTTPDWLGTKTDHVQTGLVIELKASPETLVRPPSSSTDKVPVTVELSVSSLESIKTVPSGECAIGLPQVSKRSFSESIAVPLDGSSTSRVLENGGQLTLTLLKIKD